MKHNTKDMILDISARLFSTRGLDKTRVEEIVQQAGISRATFYNYFHSKEDVFFCLMESSIDKIQTGAEKALETETDPFRKIRTYLVTMIVGIREMTRLLNLIHEEVESFPPIPKKLVESSQRRSIGTIIEILDFGAESGVFCASNTELTAYVILSALDIYVNPLKLAGDEGGSIEEKVDGLLSVLCYGFARRPADMTGAEGGVGETTRMW